MMAGNGQLTVPPGFRFHPTDEELLYYYLRKKVSYEAIDLDVIREVDLNKLEPWDLKEKCRIGSGPQNEWYFFSHKDKKYPTGTRTNRATTAGFWKATGRDKAIHLTNSKKIGMRKTLVFYTGRAPHGQKTDWIMHEYRLDDEDLDLQQEDGWVVCRVFKKKNHNRANFQPDYSEEENLAQAQAQAQAQAHMKAMALTSMGSSAQQVDQRHNNHLQLQALYDYSLDPSSMHLPQLFSPESATAPSFLSPVSLNSMDIECSQNLLRLTTSTGSSGLMSVSMQQQHDHNIQRYNGEWSFLDKLLATQSKCSTSPSTSQLAAPAVGASTQKFPFQYLGCESDILKFSK